MGDRREEGETLQKSPRGEAKTQAARERAMRDRAWRHLDMVAHGIRYDSVCRKSGRECCSDDTKIGPSTAGQAEWMRASSHQVNTRHREKS